MRGFPLAPWRMVVARRRLRLPGWPPVPTAATTAGLGAVTADRSEGEAGPSPGCVTAGGADLDTTTNTMMRTTTTTAAPPPMVPDDCHHGLSETFCGVRLARLRCFLVMRVTFGDLGLGVGIAQSSFMVGSAASNGGIGPAAQTSAGWPPVAARIAAGRPFAIRQPPIPPAAAREPETRGNPGRHCRGGWGGADPQQSHEAERRDAVFPAGEHPAGGEPHRQRRARPVEDRAGGHQGAATAARAHDTTITQPPAPIVAAARTDEAIRPAQPLQVVQAIRIGPEPGLQLADRCRVVHARTR